MVDGNLVEMGKLIGAGLACTGMGGAAAPPIPVQARPAPISFPISTKFPSTIILLLYKNN